MQLFYYHLKKNMDDRNYNELLAVALISRTRSVFGDHTADKELIRLWARD